MPLRNSQFDTIMRDYNKKQLHSRHELDKRIAEVYGRIPEIAEIDRAVASLSVKKVKCLLSDSPEDSFDHRSAILELTKRRKELLKQHGYPLNYLSLWHDCPLCKDTGYVENEKCICFKKAAIDLLYTQSNIKEILQTENFEHFSFQYYSEDICDPSTGLSALETAHRTVRTAWNFIRNFQTEFGNIFLYGDTGVGKTYLSHCIAKELMNQTFCVMYFSAFDLFEEFAKSRFSKEPRVENTAQYILDCDLLIIDDLGTELTNNFVASQLFLCVNERIMHKKSTIISTNLPLDKFLDTYSERTFSRISSHYTMIKLFGNDIRIQKKLLGGK